MLPAGNDAVHAVESSGRNEQYVSSVDGHAVSTQLARAPLRYVNDRSLQQLQHALETGTHIHSPLLLYKHVCPYDHCGLGLITHRW